MSGAYECINECIDEIQQNKETISDDAKAVAHEFFFSTPWGADVVVSDDEEEEDYEEIVPRPNVSHYQQGGIEPIDFINSNDLNFNLGNVVKYVTRAGKKEGTDPMDDLKKAMDYLMFEQQKISKESK